MNQPSNIAYHAVIVYDGSGIKLDDVYTSRDKAAGAAGMATLLGYEVLTRAIWNSQLVAEHPNYMPALDALRAEVLEGLQVDRELVAARRNSPDYSDS